MLPINITILETINARTYSLMVSEKKNRRRISKIKKTKRYAGFLKRLVDRA